MKLNFLLYQELVGDGRVDCKNAQDEVICPYDLNFLLYQELVYQNLMKLNFLLYQELVCDGRVDCKNARDEA